LGIATSRIASATSLSSALRTASAPSSASAEHLVERLHHRRDLDPAALGEPLSRPEEIDRPHARDEPLDWRERRSEQQEVRCEHDDEPNSEVQRLDHCDRSAGTAAGDHEHERPDQQQPGVDRENSPEQR
jgi:hypothetical protein